MKAGRCPAFCFYIALELNFVMAKIVVTDGYTLNPGDLDWKVFEQFGKVEVFERTDPKQVLERVIDADIIITNKTPVSADVIKAAKNLSLICVTATGFNVVDITATRIKKIPVCNVPAYGTDSVAQHTFALLLALSNRVIPNSLWVSNGDWSKSKDWCFTTAPLIELRDKVLGIVGYGRIGQRVAEIGNAFGMKVVYFNPSIKKGTGRQVPLEEIFGEADFVSLHCPLTDSNREFVNYQLLLSMKPTAFLINTSRGQLINEQDLSTALKNNILAGAALDVLSVEPPPVDHVLLGHSNCLITPHNAWLSREARKRIFETTVQNVRQHYLGLHQNLVNGL
jgi:glycerate dehydrogenase